MSSPITPRWLFFDLDGTLADSLPGLEASIVEALASGGRALRTDDLRPFIGPGIRTILRNLEPGLTESEIDGMERCFRASYDTHGVRSTELFAGVAPTLKALRAAGAVLFIVTNKPKLATANLIEQHSLSGVFTEALSRNSREPAYATKGEMLLELIHRHSVDTTKSLMVGDTVEDHHAALQARVPFVFAEYGYGSLAADVECHRVSAFAELAVLCGQPARPRDERLTERNPPA